VKRLSLLLVLVSSSASAAPWDKSGIDWTKPPPPTAEPSFRVPRGESFQLANGVKVIVSSNRTLPLVSLYVLVGGAGSSADPEGRSGLAAFVGDLVDEGAGDLDAMGIAAAADALGATVSVGAGLDDGYAIASTLPRTLAQTFDLMAKIVTQPRFAPGDVDRVHEDRMTEIALRRDDGDAVADVVADAVVYGRDTPYGRPILGFEKELAKVTRDEVLAFYAAHWRPEGLTIVVTGDVTAADVRPLVEKSFGAWRPAAAPATAAAPKARAYTPTSRLVVVNRPGAEQSDVRLALPGPKYGGPGTVAVDVTRTLLGGTFTSRLNRRLREQLGYSYGVYASWEERRSPSAVTIHSGFFTPKTAESIKEALAILTATATKPVPEEELRRVRQNIIRGMPEKFETNAGVAGALAQLALLGLPDDFYERYLAEVPKIGPKEVQAAAKKYFLAAKMRIVIVGDLGVVLPEVHKLKLGRESTVDEEANPIK